MTYYLAVEYKPYSEETDELVRGIAYPGDLIDTGTWIQTQERELGFRYEFALDAAVAKATLEKTITTDIKVTISIEDDSPFSVN